MSFKLIANTVSRNAKNVERTISLATTKGVLYAKSLTTGALEVAGASAVAGKELYRASETKVAGTTPVHCYIIQKGDRVLADTVNNTAATHVGQRVVLNATGDKVNNTGTDAAAGVFEIENIVGVAADKTVIVKRV